MVFEPTTGNWELVLMHDKNKDMIGIGEFEQKVPSKSLSTKPASTTNAKKPVANSANAMVPKF